VLWSHVGGKIFGKTLFSRCFLASIWSNCLGFWRTNFLYLALFCLCIVALRSRNLVKPLFCPLVRYSISLTKQIFLFILLIKNTHGLIWGYLFVALTYHLIFDGALFSEMINLFRVHWRLKRWTVDSSVVGVTYDVCSWSRIYFCFLEIIQALLLLWKHYNSFTLDLLFLLQSCLSTSTRWLLVRRMRNFFDFKKINFIRVIRHSWSQRRIFSCILFPI
jgi:hypothetical protein